MALVSRCPWSGRPFSKQQKRVRLDHNHHRDLDPGCEILLHPVFDPFRHQDILPAHPFDRHRPPLALEI